MSEHQHDPFADLSTAMKSLSMRRENLYRSLGILKPGSKEWNSNNREIDAINESMTGMEAQRTKLRLEMGDVG